MGQALLVLGGGRLRLPAVRFAREAGLRAVVADENPRASARRLAHEFHALAVDDVDALVALARGLSQQGGLAGVHCADEQALRALVAIRAATGVPAPAPEALERCLDRSRTREVLRKSGIPLADLDPGQPLILVHGLFREDVFLRTGTLDRFPASAPIAAEWAAQPAHLSAEEDSVASALCERAARALGIDGGPVEIALARTSRGLGVLGLTPYFADEVAASFVTPLAHGKSPIQAWFAALSGAGGPFDELPASAATCAGWLAIRPEDTGVLAGIDGLARARSVPGIADLFVHEPGREIPTLTDQRATCGWIWGQAASRPELEYRLHSAREALALHVACRATA